jgi:hypothetical protein
MLNEIIKTEYLEGQITIENSILKCHKCGEIQKGLRKSQSFKSHLFLIAGFVQLHTGCNGTSIWIL